MGAIHFINPIHSFGNGKPRISIVVAACVLVCMNLRVFSFFGSCNGQTSRRWGICSLCLTECSTQQDSTFASFTGPLNFAAISWLGSASFRGILGSPSAVSAYQWSDASGCSPGWWSKPNLILIVMTSSGWAFLDLVKALEIDLKQCEQFGSWTTNHECQV